MTERYDPMIPGAVLKKMREQTGHILGQRFWDDIAGIVPRPPYPPCDVFRWEGEWVVMAELPGLASPGDVKVSVGGRQLHIRGTKERPYPLTENAMLQTERACGPFHRVLELPEDAAAESIQAVYRDGLLTIRFKLNPLPPERQVEVEFRGD